MSDLRIINAEIASNIIKDNRVQIIELVKQAYLSHKAGIGINLNSFFLKFPDNQYNRIIGLPASITEGDKKCSGIKWIASYPDNIKNNKPRASASIILNDYTTGYAKAFIEASHISAARTAASAALAASILTRSDKKYNLLLVGCGIISRTILEFILASKINLSSIFLCDLNEDYAHSFMNYTKSVTNHPVEILTHQEGIERADIISFATTAIEPYINLENTKLSSLSSKLILGISLRDICPDIIMHSENILDDIDHCLNANTSVHLAEQKYNTREFISGNICDAISGRITLKSDKPIIFSPFGMGILDLYLANFIYEAAKSKELGSTLKFQLEAARW